MPLIFNLMRLLLISLVLTLVWRIGHLFPRYTYYSFKRMLVYFGCSKPFHTSGRTGVKWSIDYHVFKVVRSGVTYYIQVQSPISPAKFVDNNRTNIVITKALELSL